MPFPWSCDKHEVDVVPIAKFFKFFVVSAIGGGFGEFFFGEVFFYFVYFFAHDVANSDSPRAFKQVES